MLPKGLGAHEELASEVLVRVRRQVYTGPRSRRQWKQDAWDMIMYFLVEESESCQQAGPCAVITYTDLVELAVEYLKEYPDRAAMGNLLCVIEEDTKLLGATLCAMGARKSDCIEFDRNEQQLLIASQQELNKYILLLQRTLMGF
jgi:hypothetical protein